MHTIDVLNRILIPSESTVRLGFRGQSDIEGTSPGPNSKNQCIFFDYNGIQMLRTDSFDPKVSFIPEALFIHRCPTGDKREPSINL